ncbi:fas-activated serine/threonine kinase [Astyanax mexicanus]|uniref:Fas-activated serine/threonine kinase n=1 Tax=Astyanax mexicanus TaxID=7994 RepID=A0A8T2LVQ0_ASTMX|nr:fas-activated serine/threonine kinase [Astyanax mexicanus]
MLGLHSRLVLLNCGRFALPPQPSCLLACGALASMYATRLYGGGGGKPARRIGLTGGGQPMLENHHHTLPPHHHPHVPPPQSYPPLYQGRLDAHRPHYQAHQHYHAHPQPPHLPPPHYQPHAHLHHSKKKTWNFIHEKMSYDTFFTMKRLIDRSRSVDEVLRWVTQNPGKISHNHYPVALQKIGQLLVLQQTAGVGASEGENGGSVNSGAAGEGPLPSPPAGSLGDGATRQILDHLDFQTLCDAIVSDCSKFDNFSIVNCLYAVASLGLPSDSQIVQVLEEESQGRLSQFNQKDISMVFSSSMKLHLSSQHPLIESCLAGLEKNIERERHPQTLFLLLSYYRTKWRALQAGEGATAEQLVVNRKILRLVKHTLASVSCVRDHEMALLDEMLAACASEASNKSLELIFSSHLFYQNRQEKFIGSLAEELPKKVDSITPYTMALIAKYIARHRLRETCLLDTIAEFLVKKGEYLDSKVIQKLVFPFSRMSYRPPNEAQFFSKLEMVLELKALSSPLATVNILMSLFQLGHFPSLVLHRVFSPTFISNVTNSPYALIVRRYLSLLDAAVELEHREYTGPRLQDSHKVLMFEHALTADEVNRKYSYKGLVAEALRQLVGEHGYKQDEVLAPGYCTDFLLWIDHSGCVLPIRAGSAAASLRMDSTPCAVVNPKSLDGSNSITALTSDFQKFSPFSPALEEGSDKQPSEDSVFLPPHMRSPARTGQRAGTNGSVPLDYNTYYSTSDYYATLAKEHSLESQDSSTLSSPSDCLAQAGSIMPCTAAPQDSLFQFSIGKILEDEGGSSIPTGANPVPDCEIVPFYEGVTYEGEENDVVTATPLQLLSADPPETERSIGEHVKRVIMSVNDKWHYCHNSDVLVGSRAMRDRHLQLLGYIILQLPYLELEKLNGIEEVKQYLHKKLLEVPL